MKAAWRGAADREWADRVIDCGRFLAGLLMLPVACANAGAPRKQDGTANYELHQAIYCIIVGPDAIANSPYPGTPSIEQARADCVRYVAKFRASGLTPRDADLLVSDVLRIVYLCPDGKWRAQVQIEPGLFSSKWQELPGGKIVQSGFGPPEPPVAE
jgi:hypothetical protein